jgi:phosphosulfolactate synthase (CoM biosynthesis protein A)
MPKAFDFVKIEELPPKPRKHSIIEIRGPYYSAVTYNYLQGILDDWGEYIDGFKFAGGSQRLLDKEKVKKIIELCHDYNVYVSTGGFIERVALQGSEAVRKYIEECKHLEFDVIEVSSGFIEISLEDMIKIIKDINNANLKAKPEISFVKGAGGGIEVLGYEVLYKNINEVIKQCEMLLKSGAYMLMLESEGITEGLPTEKWRIDIIKTLIEKFGYEKWMFEAAEPQVFKWYLKNVGKKVNLFIDHSQIVEFNAWRLGLWGDKDIWTNAKFSYK